MGFVVLSTNPRGSTSYGEEFGHLIHPASPGAASYDLDSGVLGNRIQHRSHLYLRGGSFTELSE